MPMIFSYDEIGVTVVRYQSLQVEVVYTHKIIQISLFLEFEPDKWTAAEVHSH